MRNTLEEDQSNSSRYYLRKTLEEFSVTLKPGIRVLDAGAGTAPYRDIFKDVNYETADRDPNSNYVCDLHDLPFEDGVYDAAISTQTLEHTQEPQKVLRELFRVMRPGAPILLTAPFYYEEHMQPYDFFRFTSFGIKYLFDKAGFQIDHMDWLEGAFGAIGYSTRTAAETLAKLDSVKINKDTNKKIQQAMTVLQQISVFFNSLDIDHKITTVGYPKNYVVLAHKPVG